MQLPAYGQPSEVVTFVGPPWVFRDCHDRDHDLIGLTIEAEQQMMCIRMDPAQPCALVGCRQLYAECTL